MTKNLCDKFTRDNVKKFNFDRFVEISRFDTLYLSFSIFN